MLFRSGEAQIQAGYTPFGDDVIEAIRVGSEGHREFLHLEAGRPYVFVGACDQSCTDVDMEIIGPRGEVIASDMAPDDRPVVGVTPPRDGDYVVHITLADCSAQQCVVGMRGFRRERARR